MLKNLELITVLEKPIKEVIYHKFVHKHIAAKIVIVIDIIDNTVKYEVRWNTAKLRGKSEFLKIKDAIEYYNTL